MQSKRDKVLVLIKGLGIGGAERLISEGSRFWDRERYDYSIAYVLPWKDQLVPEIQERGIDVQMIGGRKGMTAGTPYRLRQLVRDAGSDLVHAHLPTMGVLARIASPAPVVYTEHNVAASYRRATRLASRATYGRNTAVIAVSDAVADSVASWPGPTPVVINNGVASSVSPSEITSARRELGIEDHTVLVTHVGNIRPGKGHENLIAAAESLASRRDDFIFVSIGVEKYPGDLDRLRRLATEAGVGERIRFLGRRPDALGFVGAADIFVNPSEFEGLPVAVLEAMAVGKPIVATAVGGVPTVIRDGETGLLVAPQRPESLAAAIESLLEDRALAEQFGKAARHLVENEYGLEGMVRSTEKVYERVLHG